LSYDGMSATTIARAIGLHESTGTRRRERAAAPLRRRSDMRMWLERVVLDLTRWAPVGVS
jgi:hypothetical protein